VTTGCPAGSTKNARLLVEPDAGHRRHGSWRRSVPRGVTPVTKNGAFSAVMEYATGPVTWSPYTIVVRPPPLIAVRLIS
jgi:hypothetical protein